MAGDPFRPLRLEYLENAQKTGARVEQLAPAAAADPEARTELRRIAHNLRGSGGFYGFHAISHAAAALEELLLTLGEGVPSEAPDVPAAGAQLCEAIRTATLP